MYVRHLHIQNFRCFEDAEVSLNYPGREPKTGERLPTHYPNINLFIGPNGAGKTSVFKALCLSVLGPVLGSSGLQPDYFIRRPVGYLPAVNRENETSLADAVINIGIVVGTWDARSRDRGDLIGGAIISLHGDVEVILGVHSGVPALEGIFHNDSPAFFLVAYGANRRAANPEGYTERPRLVRFQRVASVFEEYAGLIPFSVGHLELTNNHRLTDAVRILHELLPDGVRLTDKVDTGGRPLFELNGVFHPYTALSDGIRGYVSWVWDLLVQMSRVLGGSFGPHFDTLSGVVIVDEIDLFIYPEWQRTIMERLAEAFPKIQFLFSTHSPLVVGMLEAANIRVVRREGDGVVIEQYSEEVEGKTPNELLRSAYFGLPSTRSPHSGTLAEQAAKELEARKPASRHTRPRIRPLSEDQKRAVERAASKK